MSGMDAISSSGKRKDIAILPMSLLASSVRTAYGVTGPPIQSAAHLLKTPFTNRRSFLGALSIAAFADVAIPRVNAARLRRHIEELSVFGRPEGVSRVAHSDA